MQYPLRDIRSIKGLFETKERRDIRGEQTKFQEGAGIKGAITIISKTTLLTISGIAPVRVMN